MASGKVKLFILVNPHNPVGRVWKKEELERLGELCVKYGVLIFSTKSMRTLYIRDMNIL